MMKTWKWKLVRMPNQKRATSFDLNSFETLSWVWSKNSFYDVLCLNHQRPRKLRKRKLSSNYEWTDLMNSWNEICLTSLQKILWRFKFSIQSLELLVARNHKLSLPERYKYLKLIFNFSQFPSLNIYIHLNIFLDESAQCKALSSLEWRFSFLPSRHFYFRPFVSWNYAEHFEWTEIPFSKSAAEIFIAKWIDDEVKFALKVRRICDEKYLITTKL